MSKINPLQAAALSKPVDKTEPAKAPATKPAAAKSIATKSVAAKTVTAKPVVAKPTATKPTVMKPAATKPAVAAGKAKAIKPAKAPKLKMERDSFTMPKVEYAQFSVLKERLAKLGQPAKKSELLRAGIMQLTAMTDAALKAVMSKVPTIKTGRPKKK